ncbi:hypothetical protein H5079_04520 [Pseudoalteromonas sp. SG44-5]|uniref:hypothetical protein n=1 Tax=Pseudoalteromonas sp. SG44-5 TaxID=2760960 RepID=UPI0015FB7613|nr:hypothetical protein [Pseudoalteromonas sp. SG44-5]MBB1404874.1 hypothetical protein [Pseudoalteromonas sp. SG44-5]
MANYEEHQNFTINPRNPQYQEVLNRRAVKAGDVKKSKARRNVEAYKEQREIDREYNLEHLLEGD